ncbi:phage tail protein [Bartonella raoultii]|uniref:Phage tail protein n=1 Tax=Bartonella raoultii TaxID=1457020 RepID=A0ABS7I3M8_9HYPH|nr:phage tail protein [Bartonella raoultii]MBX4335269.1 phage tail protein [Bartonella raoultii]
MSSIYNWSLIASENAYADENINWAEGQPPSSVNDSARVMMQRIKEYLLDNSGMATARASIDGVKNISTFRLTIQSAVDAYTSGIVVRFKAPIQNIGQTNIALNQLSECPVFTAKPYGISPLEGGEMQRGGLYELVYSAGLFDNKDGWFLTNPTIEFPEIPAPPPSIPSGFIGTFATEKIPDDWLLCDGKAYSRSKYENLFIALGETWGKGNGRTTFNVPDLRGIFLRGLDHGKGIDQRRVLGSFQSESFRAHTHEGKTDRAGKHSHEYPLIIGKLSPPFSYTASEILSSKNSVPGQTYVAGEHEHKISLDYTGGTETRPVNIAVVYAVKT